MPNHDIFAEVIGLTFIAGFTIPSFITILRTSHKKKGASTWGEDKDGNTTAQSIASFSSKPSKICLCLCIAFGVITFILRTLQLGSSQYSAEKAITNGLGWLLLVIQGFATCYSKDVVVRYNRGVCIAISCLALICMIRFQNKTSWGNSWTMSNTFSTIEVVILIATMITATSIPRRPYVFHNGIVVSPEYSMSFLTRFTFSSIENLIKLAKKKNDFDMVDLPAMVFRLRAEGLSDAWKKKASTGRLWRRILDMYKWAMMLQIALGAIEAAMILIPPIALFNIVKLIEIRGATSDLVFWGLMFGIFKAAVAWLQVVEDMVSWVYMAAPLRSQLAVLIFEKTMRQKNCKLKSTDGGESLPDDVADEQSTQRVLNYLGVDSEKVTDVTKRLFSFVTAPLRLITGIGFLITILSWQGIFCGILFMALLAPITARMGKGYQFHWRALMQARDKKADIIHEALQGARQIKFSALEDRWERVIWAQREIELGSLRGILFYDAAMIGLWILNPLITVAISLGVHAYIHGELAPAQAFTAVGVFAELEHNMAVIPELLTMAISAVVSLRRLEDFLDGPEIKNVLTRPVRTPGPQNDTPVISFDHATISWPSDNEDYDQKKGDRFVLNDVNVSFPPNQLTVICGKTGSGKSLMLNSMLGEIELLSGSITVPEAPKERYDNRATKQDWIIASCIAYVSQTPWIENGSVKENVTFGLPMDEERYKQVIEACAMTRDLELLTDGDETEIGMGGINLSGGQRWRLTLARALYSRAGIVLMDDIFSAVDVHVGQFILKNALVGKLSRGRTFILATHHLTLCKSHVKSIIELENGNAKQFSTVEELEQYIGGPCETLDEDIATSDNNQVDDIVDLGAAKPIELKSKPLVLVKDEHRQKGVIGKSVYLKFLEACGGWKSGAFFIFTYCVWASFSVSRGYWLRLWTSHGGGDASNTTNSKLELREISGALSTADNSRLFYYLGIYFALCFAHALGRLGSFAYGITLTLRQARILFRQMTFKVLRAPARWLDTVPIGRVMNRYTSDFALSDKEIFQSITWGTSDLFSTIVIIVAGIFLSPLTLILSSVLFAISACLALRIITASRATKRLESVCKSQVFEQYRVILVGLTTIRAYKKEAIFLERAYGKLNHWSSTVIMAFNCHAWLIWKVSMLGAVYLTTIVFLVVLFVTDSGLAGFVIALSMDFGGMVFWCLYHASQLELRMNSAERIIEYGEMPMESQDGVEPPAMWPTAGCLDVKDLVVGYSPDLPSVLKGLSFKVASQERVGIVGRTGSGKSTLTLALFRFVEAREGSIIIDGQDISKMKLQSLRRNLAIIPQDPVLFSGTLRSNLDADDEYDDTVLFDALRRVHLIPESGISTPASTGIPSSSASQSLHSNQNQNQNIFLKLSSPVSEGGQNLSQGQRQLLCLARAIIRRPKILILDEATSSVDVETDALIQKSIREEFVDTTLLVIAHRLSTVGDFDKIMVMSDGRVEEFGSPRGLIEGEGAFWGMVRESGEMERLVGMSGL